MRILVTSDTYLPRLGGGEYHVFYLNAELRKLGHQVRLVTTEPGIDPSDAQDVVRIRGGIRGLPAAFRLLWKEASTADVMHSHYSYRLAFVAGTVAFLRRKPFVVTQHGLGLLPQAGAKLWQDVVFRIWRRWSMTAARAVISTSHDLSIDIKALGFGSKIVHIPNGYDPARFKPLPPPEPPGNAPMILTVRRLVPKNGIQYLVAALPLIRERFPNARHVCIGDGRLRADIEKLAADLGVADAIEFMGPQGHETLVEAYRSAHVVVLPSSAESTSLSCIEAMALRRPVVASRVGGLVELLGSGEERGTLVPLFDSEHCDYDAPFRLPDDRIRLLANAVIRALSDEEAWKKADRAAEHVRTNLAWPIIASETERLMEAFQQRRFSRAHNDPKR